MTAAAGLAPAFSRPLDATGVPDEGVEMSIEANEAERAAVAKEIGLPAIAALAARFEISRRSGGRLKVDGGVTASITQVCVVSLDPFDSDIAQPIEATFAEQKKPVPERPARHRRERPAASEPAPTADPDADAVDPIVDGRIDLGAVAVEFLTLALDFYPRKPGVRFTDVVDEGDQQRPSAFAALGRLKDRS